MKYRIKIKLLGLIPLKQFTATPINPKKLASAVYGYMGIWVFGAGFVQLK